MKNNYVLIDLENVQPESLDALLDHQFKVIIFVGANQNKLPFNLVASIQRFGASAQYIKVESNGKNALDFQKGSEYLI